jgi:nicotinamidase-related amidase
MDYNFTPEGSVEVPPIPFKQRVDLPPEKTALIVNDMQNDFVRPNGTLVVPSASLSVPNIQRLLERARTAGARIVHTQDTSFPDDPEFNIWPAHCLQGSWGWEIIEELSPQEGELVCLKNRYDAFYGTWLDHFLKNTWDVKYVIIVGTVANICVLHTAASAGLRWYHVVVPADGISAFTPFDQALTLHQVGGLYAGSVVRSVDDIQFTGGMQS